MKNNKTYKYDAEIQASVMGKGGAYVVFPYDIRSEFRKGRVKVHATFDGEKYDGSIVNMGVKNEDGSVCYISNRQLNPLSLSLYISRKKRIKIRI